MSGFDISTVKMNARHKGLQVDPPRDERKGWEHNLWSVTFRRDGVEPLRIPYKTGTGIKGAPSAAEVLQSLQLDVQGLGDPLADFENSFRSWADDCGYSSDSREAEAIFRQCAIIEKDLRAFFLDDFEAFMAYDFDDHSEVADRHLGSEPFGLAAEVAK